MEKIDIITIAKDENSILNEWIEHYINLNINIIDPSKLEKIDAIVKKIDYIYKDIKKNEIAPKTDYLFKNIIN
mgnify:CR=1 FL=1